MCFISVYSVLNTLSEYTYFYISKNITSYTFLLVFKIGQNLQCILKDFVIFRGKHLCWSLFFTKILGLKDCNFIKKRLQDRCFPANIAKFLRTPILKNIYKWSLPLPPKSRNLYEKFNIFGDILLYCLGHSVRLEKNWNTVTFYKSLSLNFYHVSFCGNLEISALASRHQYQHWQRQRNWH